jgi:hypothetical protein
LASGGSGVLSAMASIPLSATPSIRPSAPS